MWGLQSKYTGFYEPCLLEIMLTLFAVFFAVIAAVSRCYFRHIDAATRGFLRERPIFPLFFTE
jgi:hypothetical protein